MGKRSRKSSVLDKLGEEIEPADLEGLILTLTEEMNEASADLRFEYAARLRDEIKELKRELRDFT